MEAVHLLDNWRKVIHTCRDNQGEISHGKHCIALSPEGMQCVVGWIVTSSGSVKSFLLN